MNRLLILASLLIVSLSCSKETTEPTTEPTDPNTETVVSLTASLTDTATETRVATNTDSNEGWTFVWESNDTISGWYTDCTTPNSFTTKSFDEQASTFEGTVEDSADKHRFIYPYEGGVSTTSDNYYYPIDITEQNGELNKTYLINDEQIPTEDIIDNTVSSLSMKHLGGFMVVDIYLADYVSTNTYTLTGVNYEGVPVTAEIDMTQSVDSEYLYNNTTTGTVTATDLEIGFVKVTDNGTDYLQAITRLNILPFNVVVNESLTISVTLNITNYQGTTTSKTISVTRTNGGSESLPFARATHNYTYLTLSNVDGVMSVSNCKINGWSELVYNGDLTISKADIVEIDGVYNIYSGDGLREFADMVNGGDQSIEGRLMNDIDLENEEWTPIGSSSISYNGTFDGGGYSIIGLLISNATTTNQGLFGYIDEGVVKNLKVGGSVTTSGAQHIGVVVGGALHSQITSCESLSGSTVTGSNDCVAGIVGYSYGSTITNCHNNAKASGTKYVGGIIGYCSPYGATIITNCSNSGTIYSSGTFAGGIAGKIFGTTSLMTTVINCANYGYISAGGQYTGGLVGASQGGTIYNSYNLGEVYSTSNNVGGLVGIHESYTTNNITYYAAINNCYSSAKVTGLENVGIAVGGCYEATITNCYYDSSQSGSAIGFDNNSQSVTAYSSLSSLLTSLNSGISGISDAATWVAGSDSYPTFSFLIDE